jgi:hypothetical protein
MTIWLVYERYILFQKSNRIPRHPLLYTSRPTVVENPDNAFNAQ